MTRTLAALDDSPALDATARAARAMARVLGTEVSGMHVAEATGPVVATLASRAGFTVVLETGDPVGRLLAAIDREEVVLAVVGACDEPGPTPPVGHVALQLAQGTSTALLVVPPRSRLGRDGTITRALLPLNGDPATTEQVRGLVARLSAAGVEIVPVHVFDAAHPPRYLDAAGHGLAAWRREFLARHGRPAHDLQLRHGNAWEAVQSCAADLGADLIVLAWAQSLAPGRATVVRQAMANPTIPVLLLPALHPSEPGRSPVQAPSTAPT
jgi:nucleotide-binding universal stress UspA family protein